MSPTAPYFSLSTFGDGGETHIDYESDSEIMESFECVSTQVKKKNGVSEREAKRSDPLF